MLTGRLGCIGFLNTLVDLYVRYIKSGWVRSNYLLDTRCPLRRGAVCMLQFGSDCFCSARRGVYLVIDDYCWLCIWEL